MLVKYENDIENIKGNVSIVNIDVLDEIYSNNKNIFDIIKKDEDLYVIPYPINSRVKNSKIVNYFNDLKPGFYVFDKYISNKYLSISSLDKILISKFYTIRNILRLLGAKSIKIELEYFHENKERSKFNTDTGINFNSDTDIDFNSDKNDKNVKHSFKEKKKKDVTINFKLENFLRNLEKLFLNLSTEYKSKEFNIDKALELARKTDLIEEDNYIENLLREPEQVSHIKKDIFEYYISREIEETLDVIFRFKLHLDNLIKDYSYMNMIFVSLFNIDIETVVKLSQFIKINRRVKIVADFFD